jgi:lysozyme family protein
MRFAALALLALVVWPARASREVLMRGPDVEFVLDEVARIEGGYADIAGDAGRRTWYGISERYCREEFEQKIGPWPPTPETAREFFRRWWDFSGLAELAISDRTAAMLFLFRVHKDRPEMTKLLQTALCLAGEPVKIDGELGPKTRLAVAYVDDAKLFDAFVAAAAGWYVGASTWDRFGESFLSHRLRVEVGR